MTPEVSLNYIRFSMSVISIYLEVYPPDQACVLLRSGYFEASCSNLKAESQQLVLSMAYGLVRATYVPKKPRGACSCAKYVISVTKSATRCWPIEIL